MSEDSLKTNEFWRSMESAPTDGTPFVALERWKHSGAVYARVYKYEGHPNYWHSRREGVCIRPDYQGQYVWAPLPTEYVADMKEKGVA